MAIPTAASAQLMEPEPGVEDIARTPLEILNIDAEEIPEVLNKAVEDPYAHETLEQCNDIVGEVAMIDQVLGADFDIAEPDERNLSIGSAAKSVIGSFIPFRGVIREISGANDRVAEVRLAILAGMVRRSYLKGLGQGRGCDYPARPSDARTQRSQESGESDEGSDSED